jgi:16S rRNA (cytosine967-C5)-methyltransferase
LLYATCSVFPEEGEGVVGRFGADRADCVREPLVWEFPDGQREAVSQLLPVCARRDGASALREHDGFFYACLSKRQ